MALRPRDFKSLASTDSATPAWAPNFRAAAYLTLFNDDGDCLICSCFARILGKDLHLTWLTFHSRRNMYISRPASRLPIPPRESQEMGSNHQPCPYEGPAPPITPSCEYSPKESNLVSPGISRVPNTVENELQIHPLWDSNPHYLLQRDMTVLETGALPITLRGNKSR